MNISFRRTGSHISFENWEYAQIVQWSRQAWCTVIATQQSISLGRQAWCTVIATQQSISLG
jgi:hypothetical protein